VTLADETKEVEKLFKHHQDEYYFHKITFLLSGDNMQTKWSKSPRKDRYREDKNIMTLNLVMQGFSRRRVAEFCGISHEGVSARLRKAISMLKARFPGMDIGTQSSQEDTVNITLKVKDSFSASHFLSATNGPCSNLHGHTWNVEVEVSGNVDPLTGMLVDFKVIKKALKGLLPDHKHLNDIKGLGNPTAEKLAVWLYEQLMLDIIENNRETGHEIELVGVTIWESPDAGATYRGE